jgi:pimeloyl-ACP methyl ester carboxylesterase
MEDFRPLAAALQHDFELMAVDLPGFGRSDAVWASTRGSVLDAFAQHIVSAARELGWTEPFYVLGHSHGAGVALASAALYPELVAGVIAVGSIGTPAHVGYRQLVLPGVSQLLRWVALAMRAPVPLALRRRSMRAVMRPIFSPFPVPDDWIDDQLSLLRRRPEVLVNMALTARGDPCGQLARDALRVRAPVLFIHGARDRLVPVAHPEALYRILRQHTRAEFHVMDDCGHMLQLSHAEAIRSVILSFLEHAANIDDPAAVDARVHGVGE